MNQYQFATLMRVNQATVSRWKSRGWLVLAEDGTVDVDASRELLLEKRGTLGRLPPSEARKRSGWSAGPHCMTNNAMRTFRALRS